jgi:hypothetical protein
MCSSAKRIFPAKNPGSLDDGNNKYNVFLFSFPFAVAVSVLDDCMTGIEPSENTMGQSGVI